MTNYEKIKRMSVEELAEFLGSIDTYNLNQETTINDTIILKNISDIKEWLESECDV